MLKFEAGWAFIGVSYFYLLSYFHPTVMKIVIVIIIGCYFEALIVATFCITYTKKFLPLQLIYGGKTERSIPRYKFPKFFSLSASPKHFLNTSESLKLIDIYNLSSPYTIRLHKVATPKWSPCNFELMCFHGKWHLLCFLSYKKITSF